MEEGKDQAINKGILLKGEIKNEKEDELINGRENISCKKSWIPPQREIWSGGDGSHLKEKFGLEARDPTPKKNLIRERQIPPRKKIKVGDKGERTATKVDLDLDLVGLPLRS